MRIALVGVGKVAQGNYVPFLSKYPGVQLAYCDKFPDKLPELAKTFGGEMLGSLEAVAQWKPDCAMVLTNEQYRFETALKLIELGVPRLWMEKPLTARNGQAHVDEQDFANGKTLLAAAKAKGCQTALNFNYRFFEQTLAAKRIADERRFGQVIGFTGLVHYACWSHCIDLVHHFGGPVSEISALQGQPMRKGQGIEAQDLGAVVRMENGAIGTLIGTAGISWQHPLFELTVSFENGRVSMRDLDGTLEILDRNQRLHETRTIVRDEARWTQYTQSFAKSLTAYLTAISADQQPPVTGMDGLRELQFEAAMRRSAATGQAVKLAQAFPM